MPSTTPKGFPYPLGTDRVMDGDDAIRNLATAVDGSVGAHAAGTVSITTPSADTGATTAVTFPVGRFTTAPRVFMQQTSGLPQSNAQYSTFYPGGITTAGFTASSRRYNAGATGGVWHATNVDV